jgi:biotin transport system substrate-specific component
MSNHAPSIRQLIFSAFFAAGMAAGAYVAVPVGPVPVTLQTLFVLLAGLLGGRRIAVPATLLYLTMGAIGLPVFSGGIGGFAHFASPTGGFLLGLVPAAAIAGLCAPANRPDGKNRLLATLLTIVGAIAATVALYAVGLPFLKVRLDLGWSRTFAVGLLPFIIGDTLKIVAAVALSSMFSDRMQSVLLPQGEENDERP